MKKLCLILLVGIFSQQAISQSFYSRRVDRPWVASFSTGSAKYFGDLANSFDLFQGTRYNIGIGLEKRFDPRFSATAKFTYFEVGGDDANASEEGRVVRNLKFTGSNFELSVVGVAQLFEERGRYYQRKVFNPYVFLGIGGLYFNPRAKIPATDWNGNALPNSGKLTGLRQYETEQVKYSPVTLVIPMGIGMKFMITHDLNVIVNGGYRFTFTDHLDDISTNYPGINAFADPLAAALSDRRNEIDLPPLPAGNIRGNPDKNDGYFIFDIGVQWYLPPNVFGGNTNKYSKKRRKSPKARGRRP